MFHDDCLLRPKLHTKTESVLREVTDNIRQFQQYINAITTNRERRGGVLVWFANYSALLAPTLRHRMHYAIRSIGLRKVAGQPSASEHGRSLCPANESIRVFCTELVWVGHLPMARIVLDRGAGPKFATVVGCLRVVHCRALEVQRADGECEDLTKVLHNRGLTWCYTECSTHTVGLSTVIDGI